MKALKVPKQEAERVKQELLKKDLLNFDRVPAPEKEYIYFPVKENFDTEYEIVDKELPEKEETPRFEDLLAEELSNEELDKVNTSQDLIGEIAILEIPEELEKKEKKIGRALLQAKPYLKSVYKKGKHEGTYRTQKLQLLAGEDEKETVHTENGVRLKLNVETVYFSPRLSTDRERIAEEVKPGERILVMFSGCGPYPLVISKHSEAKEIIGVEINPEAHRYGLENIKLNKADNVVLHQGDVGEVVPQLEGEFDRIVMPAPDNASEYLETAFQKIKSGGTIHYYDFLDEGCDEAREVVASVCEKTGKECEIVSFEKAGQVGPGRYRVCTELRVI